MHIYTTTYMFVVTSISAYFFWDVYFTLNWYEINTPKDVSQINNHWNPGHDFVYSIL